jgi:hypothetical protein
MLKRIIGRWRFIIPAIICLFAVVFILSLFIPLEYEICGEYLHDSTSNCSNHHVGPYILFQLIHISNKYNGLITAIATVLLAVITCGLVLLGRDQSRTSRAELRAYLSVTIGAAIFQDDRLRFEGKPTVVNNGQTPAYNVRYSIRSEILTESIAANYIFTAPPDTPRSQSSIGPRENRLMSGVLSYRVQDGEVADIKYGKGKCLWTWGVVYYDDVFGKTHFTQFCQRLTWTLDDAKINGIYDPRFALSD